MENSYVYVHLNPVTKSPFYVGCSISNNEGYYKRAFSYGPRSKSWSSYVNEHGFDVVIADFNMSLEDAKALELSLIQEYGMSKHGGLLTNSKLSSASLVHRTETQKEIIALTQKARDRKPLSPIHKQHISQAMRNSKQRRALAKFQQ